MASGGTLTHHHAVGYEHMPWMEQEVSATGFTALRALKASLDPSGILNPGKLIPQDTRQGATAGAATGAKLVGASASLAAFAPVTVGPDVVAQSEV